MGKIIIFLFLFGSCAERNVEKERCEVEEFANMYGVETHYCYNK